MKGSRYIPKHELWLQYAEDDLIVAKMLNGSTDRAVVAVMFHAQQCAEKALKAYLVHGRVAYPKTHDLLELLNICVDKDSDFSILAYHAAELTPFATKSRYPESYYPMLFTELTDESILYAEKIFEFVKEKTSTSFVAKGKPRIKSVEY